MRRPGRSARACSPSPASRVCGSGNPEARPVPVVGRDAAQAAQAPGRGRPLLIDLAGPVRFVVESAELAELAAGHELRPTSVGYAWFAPI